MPAYWPADIDQQALRIAAHWFRDIGGYATLRHRQLCHIARRLIEGDYHAKAIHAAVAAYAKVPGCVKHKSWKDIGKWFTGTDLDTWAERAADRSRQAEHERIKDAEQAEAAQHRAEAEQQEQTRVYAGGRQQREERKRQEAQKEAARQAYFRQRWAWFESLPEAIKANATKRVEDVLRKHAQAIDPTTESFRRRVIYWADYLAAEAGHPRCPRPDSGP